jgi:glycosyltransferase involved in cell wall biosynthesis
MRAIPRAARDKPRLAILTNVLAPYRVPIFRRLAQWYEVTVLYTGEEGNRGQWQRLDHSGEGFRIERSKGFTFAWTKRDGAAALDTRYLHITPGLVLDLIRIRPQAIITNEMGFRSFMALAYGSLFRRPIWVWWGGTRHTERGIGTLKRIFRRYLVARVRRWFSYGATSTEYLASLGVDPKHVVELQNCVPESRYREPVPPAFQVEPRPVLLYTGRLVPGKGVDLLLRAAARIQAEDRRFSILIVGDGPERQSLEATAEALKMENVHFRASCAPADMAAVYRSGDVLVFPTLDDVWGLVVNEALWSGIPALVSTYAGCSRELVPPESTFDPLDPVDFDAKLRDAVREKLPPPDLARLRSINEVADTLLRELSQAV